MSLMMEYVSDDLVNSLIDGDDNLIADQLFPEIDSKSITDARPIDHIMPNIKTAMDRIRRSASVVKHYKNIVVTGESGTGKTFAIRQMIAHDDMGGRLNSLLVKYRRFDETLFYNFLNTPSIEELKLSDATILSDVIQRMVSGLHDERLIVVLSNQDVAALMARIAPNVMTILEMPSSDADRFIRKQYDIIDRFEFIYINQEIPTWGDVEDELWFNEKNVMEKVYSSRLDRGQMSYAMKNIASMAIAETGESLRVTKNSDAVLPIDFMLMALEHLHIFIEQNHIDISHVSRSAFRKSLLQFYNDLPNRVDYDTAEKMTEDYDQQEKQKIMAVDDQDELVDTSSSHASTMSPSGKTARKEKKLAYSDITTLADRLKKKVVNQDEAIDKMVDCIKIDAAGLRRGDRPIASFLFDGPSGVGKTELAKQLAEELFEKPVNMIRLDMSEYSVKEDVTKLFGSAPGYQDNDLGGQLTNKVNAHPQSVILLDEAEKAHPQVWNSFLQVLDEGRMTDGRGVPADFTNTIIILTSNLGNRDSLTSKAGFGHGSMGSNGSRDRSDIDSIMRKAMNKYFSPELLARIDVIVTFNRLRRVDLSKIITMQIRSLSDILSEHHDGLSIDDHVSNDLVDLILNDTDSTRYGARELQRVIRSRIVLPMANWVISYQKQNANGDILHMSRDGDAVRFAVSTKEK
jgi:ATP-dependent Clp protease ATP-binding subunit ClpA